MRTRACFLPLLIAAVLAAAGSGCQMVGTTLQLPGKAVSAITPSSNAEPMLDPADLQARLLRYSDELIAENALGVDEYLARSATTPERLAGVRWKLMATTATLAIASAANPYVSLLDLATMTTLTRMALEHRISDPEGAAYEPWLRSQRRLETNIWLIAGTVLPPDQQQELRAKIGDWDARNRSLSREIFARPFYEPKHGPGVTTTPDPSASLLGVIGFDPMAGLDPAVREVTRSRMLAERGIFLARHLPFVLRWQVELLTEQIASRPDVARALTNLHDFTGTAERFAQAAESISATAASLPDRLSAERSAILGTLEDVQGRLGGLAGQLTTTLTAGERTSASLNTTLTTFDALMKRFGVGEPGGEDRGTNAAPFRILDYAETADRLAVAARELDVLVKDLGGTLDSPALDRRVAELETASRRVQADLRALLNHAFLLGAALVIFAFLCALGYRALGRPRPGGDSSHR